MEGDFLKSRFLDGGERFFAYRKPAPDLPALEIYTFLETKILTLTIHNISFFHNISVLYFLMLYWLQKRD